MAFKDPERKKEYHREWRLKNKDKLKANHKRWYEKRGKEMNGARDGMASLVFQIKLIETIIIK